MGYCREADDVCSGSSRCQNFQNNNVHYDRADITVAQNQYSHVLSRSTSIDYSSWHTYDMFDLSKIYSLMDQIPNLNEASMSLHEVRLGLAGRLSSSPSLDHPNISSCIIKRSKVHVDPHLLSKLTRAGIDLQSSTRDSQSRPLIWQRNNKGFLPLSAVIQPDSNAWRSTAVAKSTAMSLIAVVFEYPGHFGRSTPPLRWPSLTITAPGPLFPQYERIAMLGTRGGKSRERQVQCLELHVMAMMHYER